MTIAIISHEVNNFAAWKKQFDTDSDRRHLYDFREIIVGTKSDNPKKVFIVAITDPITFGKMMDDPELKFKMQENGVVSVPEVTFINT
jgi:hypothetical protein